MMNMVHYNEFLFINESHHNLNLYDMAAYIFAISERKNIPTYASSSIFYGHL